MDTQYFNVAMIPEVAEGQPLFTCFSGSVDVTQDPSDIDRKQRRRTDVSFRLQTMPLEVEPYDVRRAATDTYDFTIFTGLKFPNSSSNTTSTKSSPTAGSHVLEALGLDAATSST
ncbi:MAG: hypothetical protein R3B96_15310 [Pirellulaceae bacterium]